MLNSTESQAIDAALNCRWSEAVKLNAKILAYNPEDIEALTRLGRAYMELAHYRKATDAFKKVLEIDSLNLVARKNLDIIKNGNDFGACQRNDAEGSFIIEPGTTKKILVHLDSRIINARKLVAGQKFTMRLHGDQVEVLDLAGKTVGSVCENDIPSFVVARKVYNLKCLDATFLTVSQGSLVEMLAKATEPVFKGEKQEINPEARLLDAEVIE